MKHGLLANQRATLKSRHLAGLIATLVAGLCAICVVTTLKSLNEVRGQSSELGHAGVRLRGSINDGSDAATCGKLR